MRGKIAFLASFVLIAAGCATTDSTKNGDSEQNPTEKAVAARAGEFVDVVMADDFEGIRPMVIGSQRNSYSPEAFVLDRFRARLGSFQVVVVDKKRIGAANVKDTRYVLSSMVVHARFMTTNDVLPIVVNLYWQQQGGTWYIVPYPELE
mgnify:CR=1 FL=1